MRKAKVITVTLVSIMFLSLILIQGSPKEKQQVNEVELVKKATKVAESKY